MSMSVYTSVKHGSEYTTFGHTEPDLLSPVRCRESIRKLDGSSTDVDELRTTLERVCRVLLRLILLILVLMLLSAIVPHQ